MTATEVLAMLRMLDDEESDGGAGNVTDRDSDVSWSLDSSSSAESDSDNEFIPRRKKSRLDISDPGTDLVPSDNIPVQNPDPSNVPSVPRQHSPPRDEEPGPINPLSAERRETAKDGTVWTYVELGEDRGRRQCQNVITEAAGPTAHAKRNIEDALTAFLCLVDDGMLKHIRDCTVAEAHRVKEDNLWDMTIEELKAFISLIYIRGAQGGKGMDLATFWSAEWGCAFFKETMSRNRFQEIMRFLRFDKRETRRTRLRDNKFALMSDVWDKFVQNCIACYKPGADITVDEQLFPTKSRCSFIQYIANKPDKFGIKFWLAADVDTKYMVNGAPYLGKDETRRPGQRLADSVVLKMVDPYLGKGRNVTTDNFFTSFELAKALQAKKTSLVGTVNKSRRELPPCVKAQKPLFSTEVLKSGDATLTVYQGKKKKNVCILSTVHTAVGITSGQKRKPETVTYYNKTKVGVDVLDQMARKYSVKAPSRRWPVAVFYNILDLAAINAHILYNKCTNEHVSRRDFITRLASVLRSDHMGSKTSQLVVREPGPGQEQQQMERRRQCQVRRNCKQNKTKETCAKCRKVVCGSCTRKAVFTCVDCA
ncbi:piggyBac transposable element-derived protein 3-like [Rhinichthys klamathensis goyatoka]|uniref:piggyBac transposable element-derived protein 3-like n=1 Tax=Rhinichthys klamathensis goyatoka TaxID=3034132 RepID=UPI0024B482AA|nr:piggyBac transposable element-derived protein 3-like [Rhinichthys klamathensis goyatoka]